AAPFDLLARLTGRNLPITSDRIRKLSADETSFASDRIRETGYEQPVSLQEGLAEMVRWYLREGRLHTPVEHLPPERPRTEGGAGVTAAAAPLGRVVAVVVTYNRAELLQACLDGLAAQTRPVDAVVVIDNASSDGSGDVARAHPVGAEVHTLGVNVGGAGGFAAGMALALTGLDPDWLWLMDDDTVPTPSALAEAEHAVARAPGARDRLVLLSSTAVR